MPDVVHELRDYTVLSPIEGVDLIGPLVTIATEAATEADAARDEAVSAAEDAGTQVEQILAILGRADLYQMDQTYEATQFLSRGREHLFTEDYYRIGSEVETVLTDLTGTTFTRSTVGYALQVNGTFESFAINIPRITDRGYYPEPAATNLLPRFAPTVAQLSTASNTTNVGEASSPPIAGLAWISLGNTGVTAQAFQTVTITGSATYTLSCLIEAPDGIQPVAGSGTTDGDFRFTLGSSAFYTTPRYERLSGNIWRVSMSGSAPASPGQSHGVQRLSGQNTRSLKFSGFQLEAGSVRSSPIYTTGTAGTRTADVLTETAALTASEDFTLYGEVEFTRVASVVTHIGTWSDGTSDNLISVLRNASGNFQLVVTGATTATTVASVAKTGARTVKFAVVRENGAYRFHVDGAAQTITPPSVAPGALTTLHIGSNQSGALQLTDFLKALVVIPTALDTTQANALTA